MTVAELIEHLSQFPADLPVLVQGYETGWDAIHALRTDGVVSFPDAADWDGEYVLAADSQQAGQPALLIVGRRGARR